MKTPGIGVDAVDVARFRPLTKKKHAALLARLFTESERVYCLSYRDPAPHFAGLFAAKEAASKALCTGTFPVLSLEIRHAKDGSPQVWKSGRRVRVGISITHTETIAAAVALV
jgi:holo-[acyl-carrier protein] synthase